MPAPAPHDVVIHGGNGEDHLVDDPSLVTHKNSKGQFTHGTALYGHGGNDHLWAESGLGANGDHGTDLFDGGSGVDTLYYTASNAGMVVDLTYFGSHGRAYATGYSTDFNNPSNRIDLLYSIENVYGSAQADQLYGSDVANYLTGMAGNDVIDGRAGHDTLNGFDGDDTVSGGLGDDLVSGGDGHDALNGDDGDDTIDGGDGNDVLHGGDDNDHLSGGAGTNQLYGDDGNDILLLGEAGAAWGGAGNDTVIGGTGHDPLDGGSGHDVLDGLAGNDVLTAGPGNDTVHGGQGYDTGVFTDVAGATVVYNGATSGLVLGPTSTDTFDGVEAIRLGSGADAFLGNQEANKADLGDGADAAYGADGADILNGEGGNDTLYGQDGNDSLIGGDGHDVMHGGDDHDVLTGGSGNDQLFGDEGDDNLVGGSGADTMDGGSGNDVLQASGADRLIGGAGNDTINLASGAQEVRWMGGHTGLDTINGFNPAQDSMVFSRDFFAGGVGPIDLDDYLMVFVSGNDAWLAANTAATGWDFIAVFPDTSAWALHQAIEDGALVHLIGTGYAG